jgi:hypothetical protein
MRLGWLPFNLNHYVRVRLTPVGLDILRRQHNELINRSSATWRDFEPPATDAEGWSQWQLWELFNHFGEHITMGRYVPFETAIEFEAVGKKPEAARVNQSVLVRHKEAVGDVYDVAVFVGKQPDGEQRWIMGDTRLEARQLEAWFPLPASADRSPEGPRRVAA